MGTPDFAVASLEALLASEHMVSAVFTQPDKPQGRKMIMTPSPVKLCAEAAGIPVYQPRSLRSGEALETLKELAPELIVVVAYGKILPQDILSLPKYGCMNIHGSLLPKYRGASPIQWSIVCGETRTGVTSMYMDEGIDTGDMIFTSETDILPEDDAVSLTERLSELGAQLAVKTVNAIENGSAPRTAQSESEASYAPMIAKEAARLDFEKPAQAAVDLIRGLIAWPTAWFMLDGAKIKVYSARAVEGRGGRPGEVLCSAKRLIIQCGEDTALELLEVKPEGKGKMAVSAMLSGRKIAEGSIIG